MAAPLYRRQPAAVATAYADVENHALHQGEALLGTPGSITLRTNARGSRFYVRQYYDFEGRKRDQYLVAATGSPEDVQALEDWTRRVEDMRRILGAVRLLIREGYAAVTPKHLAALVAVSNHGMFTAGGVLVGTHAFDVIVNRLGIRVASFRTEDIDLARPMRLALREARDKSLLEMLRESGIDIVEVPGLGRKDPPASFKERGRSRFTIDLLVPASGNEIAIQAVPELRAHATALPYLRFLVAETQTGAVISTHGVAMVRVPLPERFALHKLIVSQARHGRTQKSEKDLVQAAALIAALGEIHPGALESAFLKTPTGARARIRKSLQQVRNSLQAHPASWDEIAKAAKV